MVLVSLSCSSQPLCVSGCDMKFKFPVRRGWHACDSQGRFEWVLKFTRGGGGSCDQRLHFPVVVIVSKKCFHRTVTVTILTDYFVTPLSFIRL